MSNKTEELTPSRILKINKNDVNKLITDLLYLFWEPSFADHVSFMPNMIETIKSIIAYWRFNSDSINFDSIHIFGKTKAYWNMLNYENCFSPKRFEFHHEC